MHLPVLQICGHHLSADRVAAHDIDVIGNLHFETCDAAVDGQDVGQEDGNGESERHE